MSVSSLEPPAPLRPVPPAPDGGPSSAQTGHGRGAAVTSSISLGWIYDTRRNQVLSVRGAPRRSAAPAWRACELPWERRGGRQNRKIYPA